MSLAFFDFGFAELLLVGVVALLVFGGNLPDVMRTLGRNYGKFRNALREFSAPVREEYNRVRDMPSPKGIVSQLVDDAAEEEPYPGSEDYDDASPPITSSEEPFGEGGAEDGEEPAAKPTKDADLLDEGPLV